MLEIFVSGGRQGGRGGGFPADCQAGSQSRIAVPAPPYVQNGAPNKITIDRSGANTAAIESYKAKYEAGIEIRRNKYLNDIVEQDHRAIKRVTRATLRFKSFRSATATLAGVEVMHMIRKGQLRRTGKLRPANQFYALAA